MKTREVTGIIKSIHGKYARVELENNSIIAVPLSGARRHADDHVVLLLSENNFRRFFISIVLPLLVTSLLFVIFENGTGDERLSGLMAAISLGPYFAAIYLLKDSLSIDVRFR